MAETKKKVIKKSKKVEEEIPTEVASVEESTEAVEAPVAEKSKFEKPEKFKNSFIVSFTIEGHKAFRISMFGTRDGFKNYLAQPGQKKHPKVTSERWYSFDAVTGEINPIA